MQPQRQALLVVGNYANMNTEKELFEKAEKIYHQYSEARYPKAIQAFKDLLNFYPENVQGWCMLSTMQFCNKLYDDAIVSINKAISLDKTNISILEQKGTLLQTINEFEYEDSKFIDKKLNNVIEINYFKNKKEILKEIIKICDEIIEIASDDYYRLGSIHETKARALRELFLWQASIDSYKMAIEFHKKYSEKNFLNPIATCYFNIAKIYENIENYNLAIVFFEKEMQEEFSLITLIHKANVLCKMGKIEESEKTYNKFIEIAIQKLEETSDAAYMFQISDLYYQRNLLDKAYEILTTWESKVRNYNGLQERIKNRKNEIMKN